MGWVVRIGTVLIASGALKAALGLELVGPYDVLAGRLKGVSWEKCVLHTRHFYDPPEMTTVLSGDGGGGGGGGYHMGYFRCTLDTLCYHGY